MWCVSSRSGKPEQTVLPAVAWAAKAAWAAVHPAVALEVPPVGVKVAKAAVSASEDRSSAILKRLQKLEAASGGGGGLRGAVHGC